MASAGSCPRASTVGSQSVRLDAVFGPWFGLILLADWEVLMPRDGGTVYQ